MDEPEDLEESAKRKRVRVRVAYLGLLLVLALGAEAIYAWRMPEALTVFSLALLTSAAAFMTGSLLGFLFGIPRTVSSETLSQRVEAGSSRSVVPSVRANTNLEQISDWLTKILVGLGLTQLTTIKSGAIRLFDSVGHALGAQPSSSVFAGTVIVYFVGLGFLLGWLLTRLLLGGWMTKADRVELKALAEVAEAKGHPEEAQAYRATAEMLK